FTSDENTQKENTEKFLGKLSDYARTQVIQAIQVQIDSKVTNDMTVRNGDVDQVFQQTSVSLATAEIAGLEFKTYYDPATKIGYAIAFAKRETLVAYYKEKLKTKIAILPQKIAQSEQLIAADDKKAALKTYYECMPVFKEIEEAQALLIALNVSGSELSIKQVSEYRTAVQTGISKLQNSSNLDISQLAYFLAYGLYLQVGDIQNQLYVGPMTFQDTEMESDFSKRFLSEFQQNLVKAGKFKLQQGSYDQAASLKGFYSNYYVDGTYWEENGKLKVIVLMRDTKTGKTKASAEASIATQWLQQNNINYLPEALKKIEQLAELKIMIQNPNYNCKVTNLARTPLEVFTVSDDEATPKIPVRFKYLTDGSEIATIWSDAKGSAQCILAGIKPSTNVTVLVAELDVAAFLGLDKHSNFAKKMTETRSIPQTKIFATIEGPSAFFLVREADTDNRSMQIPFIEPKLKESLSNQGYTFANDASQAEIMITVNAKSRRGNEMSGLYFVFVDANVSVMDLVTGKEIYKNAYTDIKGGSANWDRANAKAYEQAAERITKEIVETVLSK
ncbi:MAG: hypothetical protein RIS47_880, partial [Bacteroidota bacterium]